MVRAKKLKGQQRKAAKAKKESDAIVRTTTGIIKADNKATLGLVNPDLMLSTNEVIEVLPAVLSFLKRCEDETFHQVLRSVRGDLRTPATWIEVLLNCAIHVHEKSFNKSLHLQIVENIRPLVRCMCNDTERLFFKSIKHWNESIVSFVQLISTITCHSINDREEIVTDTLFKYDGLLTSIVQWTFWGMRDRPDIARDLQLEDISHICLLGRKTTEMIVCSDNYVRDEMGLLTEKGRSIFDIVATTPFVSKGFDPACMVSFVAGYIGLLKTEGMNAQDDFLILKRLIREADCVDKGVVSELIDLGLRYVLDHESACFVADISHDMLYREIKAGKERDRLVCDSRVAFAIRAGLVEMCLSFIKRFGVDNTLYGCIHGTFKCIYSINFHTKSAKAIRNKRHDIEKKLDSTIMNNADCKKLVEIVGCILGLNESHCCRCNKPLSKTEVLQCNGCSSMVYCSKACQKDDWVNCHSLTCNKSYTLELAGQFQGRMLPMSTPDNKRDALKLKEIEINMNMIQLKLFLDNAETIQSQVEVLGIPLCDCVVRFDLRWCPPKIETKSYTEFYKTPEELMGFESSRSKENIRCVYLSSLYVGDSEEEGFIAMQRFFPHEWLTNKNVE